MGRSELVAASLIGSLLFAAPALAQTPEVELQLDEAESKIQWATGLYAMSGVLTFGGVVVTMLGFFCFAATCDDYSGDVFDEAMGLMFAGIGAAVAGISVLIAAIAIHAEGANRRSELRALSLRIGPRDGGGVLSLEGAF